MRTRSMVLVAVATGCGFVASVGISQTLRRSASAGQVETLGICVAATDIDINDRLDADTVRQVAWPKDKVPAGAVTKLDHIQGQYALTRMYQGEPIIGQRLSDSIVTKSIAIPPGFRVCSLKVRMDTSVSGLVQPGDRVDIIGFFRDGLASAPQKDTRTVLSNVRVFAVNSETEQGLDTQGQPILAKTVSVLVKQNQVESLVSATEQATLHLALRHPNDSTHILVPEPTEDDPPPAGGGEADSIETSPPTQATFVLYTPDGTQRWVHRFNGLPEEVHTGFPILPTTILPAEMDEPSIDLGGHDRHDVNDDS